MEKPLKEMSRSPLHFIPNCVERAPRQSDQRRSIDFLWVNRIIPERKAEWVVSALRDPVLAHASLTLLGIETRSNLPGHVKEEQARLLAAGGGNITLLPFADPGQYYERAKFFCLPGTIVFGNNSLLEAMASGVVPLVTEAPGVELIIEDGVNGFVTALDEQAYRDAMARAAAMTDADWRRISESAMATVQDKYSVQAWTRKMADVYARF
jgi:glycosyltransferase involved in cell wall biosynthesis